jgi:hypothetical protein
MGHHLVKAVVDGDPVGVEAKLAVVARDGGAAFNCGKGTVLKGFGITFVEAEAGIDAEVPVKAFFLGLGWLGWEEEEQHWQEKERWQQQWQRQRPA